MILEFLFSLDCGACGACSDIATEIFHLRFMGLR